jgi:hypothetical protein
VRRTLFCLPVLLLSAVLAFAAPKVGIVAPVGPVEPYKLVELVPDGDVTGAVLFWDVDREDVADVREYGGKLVFTGPPGTYKIKLRIVRIGPDGKTLSGETQRATVVIGTPTPPAPPVPPVPPVPPPNPAPIPADGLHVLIVYDAKGESALSAAQRAVLYDSALRSYLNQKCPVGPVANQHEWWIVPEGTDFSQLPKKWQDAYARPRKSLPWILVSNPQGGGGFEGPLPADADATLNLIKQYAEPKGGK